MLKLILGVYLAASIAIGFNTPEPTLAVQEAPSEIASEKPKLPPTPKADFSFVSVRFIQCGKLTGTAFYIDKRGVFLSADHVTNGKDCVDVMSGVKMKTYFTDPQKDYSLLSMETNNDPRTLNIDCNGFIPGKRYISVGFADSSNYAMYDLIATNVKTPPDFDVKGQIHPNLRMLLGVLVPGQSGGPMIDKDTWKVVGINNVTAPYTNAYSREIKDTILCKS